MVISYFGAAFLKVVFGDTTLAFNPISKQSKQKQTRFGADIALISLNHEDLNGVENVTHGERTPFVISGPGAYEVKKITVRGFGSTSSYGGKPLINTVYLVTLEGMQICFLGALGSPKLSAEIQEALLDVDILFVPVLGEGVLTPTEAHELSVMLEPHIVIPILYNDATLKKFLKEEGEEHSKQIDKLTIKKKELEEKEGEIVVLTP